MKIIFKRQKRYMEGEGGTPAGGQQPPAGGTPPGGRTFTQKEVDDLIGKRLGETQKKFDQQRQADLERMKALETDASKVAEYEKQIEELNLRYKSKEELAQDAYKKEKATWEQNYKKAEAERDSWRKRWEEQHRDSELMAAASAKEADVNSVEQMMFILKPMSQVKQKVVDGKPVDAYETRIAFPAKDGKVLDLSPAEALKLMREDVPRFGNLFKSSVAGGLGGTGSPGAAGNDTILGLTQEEFNKRFLAGTLPKKVR